MLSKTTGTLSRGIFTLGDITISVWIKLIWDETTFWIRISVVKNNILQSLGKDIFVMEDHMFLESGIDIFVIENHIFLELGTNMPTIKENIFQSLGI